MPWGACQASAGAWYCVVADAGLAGPHLDTGIDTIHALLAPTSLVHASLSEATSSFPGIAQMRPIVRKEYADNNPIVKIIIEAGINLNHIVHEVNYWHGHENKNSYIHSEND